MRLRPTRKMEFEIFMPGGDIIQSRKDSALTKTFLKVLSFEKTNMVNEGDFFSFASG